MIGRSRFTWIAVIVAALALPCIGRACGSFYTTMESNQTYVFATGTTEGDYGGWYPVAVSTTLTSPVFGRQTTGSDGYVYEQYDLARVTVFLTIDGEGGVWQANSQHDQKQGGWWYSIGTSFQSLVVNPPASSFFITTRSFIPVQWIYGPDQCSHPSWGPTALLYKGDNRSFDPAPWVSYRTESRATAVPDQGLVHNLSLGVGETRNYAFSFEEDPVAWDCWKWNASGFGNTYNMHVSGGASGYRQVSVEIFGGAGNPLSGGPEISWNYTVVIDNSTPSTPRYTRWGSHDCYPAHEAYIGSQMIHSYNPPDHSITTIASCLIGFDMVVLPAFSDRIY